MTGTPTLVTSALREDTNQALQFNGTTNSMSVADSASASLAVGDGADGGAALELFVKLTSTPGSTVNIAVKSGSYSLQANTARKLLWRLDNGANNVTVTSTAALTVGTWYHVVCVYNGDYSGTPRFGKDTIGSTYEGMTGDTYATGGATGLENEQLSKFTALEKAGVDQITMAISRVDEPWYQYIRFLCRADNAGVPGQLLGVTQDAVLALAGYPRPSGSPTHLFTTITAPNQIVVPEGLCWMGYQMGAAHAQSYHWYDASGNLYKANDTYSDGAADTMPSGTAQTKTLAVYADYTPLARTGEEGNALIYINGLEDSRSAYTRGIADSANALVFCSNAAASIDEPSIWNKKLTPVQVATHYASR